MCDGILIGLIIGLVIGFIGGFAFGTWCEFRLWFDAQGRRK
jgi:galactitol-specific phosphotransferase system IIC component